MSATASQPETDYLLRKLHSLTGIIPVGAFLAEHFWSNSYALVSRAQYDAKSQELQTIPFRLVVEWLFIFLPMLYHGGGRGVVLVERAVIALAVTWLSAV